MFMFAFSVITISVVGLFFQIVSAITAYFLSQQLSLGEQILKWHSIAFANSCSISKADGVAITDDDFGARGPEVAGQCAVSGCAWRTEFFTGTYQNPPSVRMIITYVLPTDKPSGFSINDLARQLTKVTMKHNYRFNRASGNAVTFVTYNDGAPSPITISGLPVAVEDGSVVLVSDASCP